VNLTLVVEVVDLLQVYINQQAHLVVMVMVVLVSLLFAIE
tara:strand:- start:993 stop:1112 length:120 start_codon:yes stop_codon:yes gene_type:complete